MSRDRWKPLMPAKLGISPEDHFKELMRMGLSEDEATVTMAEERNTAYFVNDIYQVARIWRSDEVTQLNIRRRDGKPIFRDWRHFQRIKNEMVGAEVEAIELYPAESRLVDTSNKYHLFCWTVAGERFPFGWSQRLTLDDVGLKRGYRQRKL